MSRIKICGLRRPEDIAAVNEARPDYCGFIVEYPKSRTEYRPDNITGTGTGTAGGDGKLTYKELDRLANNHGKLNSIEKGLEKGGRVLYSA